MKTKAFTLIELLVVISIISLLASIVMASINAARAKGQLAAALRFSAQFEHALGGDAKGWWLLDEGSSTVARDFSGNASDGAFQGSPTWSTDTVSGKGYSLVTGPSNYLLGPIPSGTFSGDWTITAWFKRTAQSDWAGIFSNSVGTNDTAIMTMFDAATGANKFGINRVGVANTGFSVDLGSDMNNKWIFGVVQKSGTTIKVFAYKDGNLYQTSGTLSWTLNSTNQFYIGKHYSGGTQTFSGLIDEIAVYADALPFARIEQLYAAGLSAHPLAQR